MLLRWSSEMFGKYAKLRRRKRHLSIRARLRHSKVAGFDLTRNYREAYDMYCVSGILFNHESPRRAMSL